MSTYRGTIHLFSSDHLATLRPNYTFQPSDSGAHDFQIALGTQTTKTITILVNGDHKLEPEESFFST